MDIYNLRNKINHIKTKYQNKQNEINKYFEEVLDVFYDYGDKTGNFKFKSVINNIICGEDLYGSEYCEEVSDVSKELYLFKSFKDVTEVDYGLLTELVDKALEEMNIKEKEIKDKDLDIC